MTSLRGALDRLAAIPAAATPLVRLAQLHGDRLAHLVDDIFLLGELGAGAVSLRMRSVDLQALVRAAIAGQARGDRARAIRFALTDSTIGARVYADPRWLASALARPLARAARATPPGGAVPIDLRAHGAFFRLICPDPGAVTGDGEAVGANLGLGIAEAILHRHGGVITRQPHPAHGMAIQIELPEWLPREG